MKNTQRPKLRLAVESVRVLTVEQLRAVPAGARPPPGDWPTSKWGPDCSGSPDC
jgi:hypothetical protein